MTLILIPWIDAEVYSPEPVTHENKDELEEEPGSFSPELLHGDEDEGAIDPEEDRAELVIIWLFLLLICYGS